MESDTKTRSATEIGSKIINPRAEIDTSLPFGSVEEAVTHFGGRGSWNPHHFLRLSSHHNEVEEFDIEKVEEEAAELEKNLIVKERETLDVLKKLEAAKRIVEVLKQKLVKEGYECMATPDLTSDSQGSTPDDKSAVSVSLYPAPSSGLILMELNEAKSNLDRTTNDLAAIRSCVESLNKKVIREKIMSEKNENRQKPNSAARVLSVEEKLNREGVKLQIASDDAEPKGGPWHSTKVSRELQQLNFESDQFRNMAEAARYEVMKAMLEIEQTKTSITMVEMRLIAAKKMEEAARAVEAVAAAEMKVRSNNESSFGGFMQRPEGITLSYEEYYTLTQEAQKAYELSKNRVVDTTRHIDEEAHVSKVGTPQKLEETTKEFTHGKKSLGEALGNIEVGNRRKVVDEEGFYRGRSEHGKMRHSGQNPTKFKFKNPYPSYSHRNSQQLDGNESDVCKDKSEPVLRSTISIGDILSRKLILQDDFVVGKHMDGHTDRQAVSLSQMLREQSGLIFSSTKAVKDESVHKQFFALRKKFGFIHVSFPSAKQSKKKA
ncbi:WEB family protein At2g38370-like [Cornus florida]|uniref:WEB family protein At2g38370-like n=1 Tax=Cornus florida TaxID=4283 RepID=UPI00289FE333|nr:WEB family protein At2g38370-like [Cornus florida]